MKITEREMTKLYNALNNCAEVDSYNRQGRLVSIYLEEVEGAERVLELLNEWRKTLGVSGAISKYKHSKYLLVVSL